MNLGICQIILTIILGCRLCSGVYTGDKTKSTLFHFATSAAAVGIEFALLYFGGFYS